MIEFFVKKAEDLKAGFQSLKKRLMCKHKNKSIIVLDAFDVYEKTAIKCCDCNKILDHENF